MSSNNSYLIEQINDTFRNGDIDAFLEFCSSEIVWNIVGRPVLKGVPAISMEMHRSGLVGKKQIIEIERIVEADQTVICEGVISPDSQEPYAFCDIYRFENGKIAELTSYMVKIKNAIA